MRITAIKGQEKSKDRFSIYVDNRYCFSLTTNDLLDVKLKVGTEVGEQQIEQYKTLSEDSLMMARAYDKCLRRPHSEKEIRDYLRTKQVDEELADRIIEKCYKYKLLDDELFASKWVEHRRRANKSNRFISGELRSKGISASIVNAVLVDSDQAQLKVLIEKKSGRYSDERKLIAYLQGQGYGYSDIKSALSSE